MGTPADPVTGLPRALTIAGSDSGGGAGMQADLKVFMALGCHGMSALTALTAQNTVGVHGVFSVDPDFVAAQIEAVVGDIGVDAAKTGMLATAAIVETVAKAISINEISRVVVDPVFVSKSQDRLLAEDAVDALIGSLFPLAETVTPNLYEAGALIGGEIGTLEEMRVAAREIHAMGPQTVLVKGGHLAGPDAIDVFFDGQDFIEVIAPRYDTTDTHGTGCALSAAIAARMAQGDATLQAIRSAKEFVSGAIRRGLRIGSGFGPVNPAWRLD